MKLLSCILLASFVFAAPAPGRNRTLATSTAGSAASTSVPRAGAGGRANIDPIIGNASRAANHFAKFLSGDGFCMIMSQKLRRNPSQNMAALWIKAVFHDAATFTASDQTGGMDASLLTFIDSPDNTGLPGTLVTSFLGGGNFTLSQADTLAIGGIATITTCGGPVIPFQGGRIDATAATATNPVPLKPLATEANDVIMAKLQRMGLAPTDIVTLVTGSHTMGGVHGAISPALTNESFVPFDTTPGIFDNDVFKQVLKGYCPLPFDCFVANDPVMGPLVVKFSQDQTAFFAQYALSFAKLTALTSSPLTAPFAVNVPLHNAVDLNAAGHASLSTLIPVSPITAFASA